MSPARQIFDVDLRPAAGSRFQPTGFPDLGPAVFKKPVDDGDWVDALLVESAQSTANHLERAGWDDAEQRPAALLEGLPYVEVRTPEGDYLTSSRTEAHRLSSAFVRESMFDGEPTIQVLRDRLGLRDNRPHAPREIARQVFALDPLSLVHGVFFSDATLPGQPKIARAITGFVEAVDVRPAHSGGVKKEAVLQSIGENARGSEEGYGMIPFHRTEWVAARITASFVIDLAQIGAYGLGSPASELLADIARWEIRMLLEGGMRLRTACYLEPLHAQLNDRAGEPLPSLDELAARVRAGVEAVDDLLERRDPWVVQWTMGKKSKKSK